MTGLVPAYGKASNQFRKTSFLHLIHNLDVNYEGRMEVSSQFAKIHGLPVQLFTENNDIFNPSRCALLSCDRWATVSPSYMSEILINSSLNSILKSKPDPIAILNGVNISKRQKQFEHMGNHTNAKSIMQRKFFNCPKLDNSCVIMSFVGRIVHQKGISLILEGAQQIITESNYKVQIFIGGKANYNDEHSAWCANRMKELTANFPRNFYANPDEFVNDGPLINLGSDFGLMPSLFEPGGIVQHEFFVAGTPVIAFRTGGLKDTVREYDGRFDIGSGFVFKRHCLPDFMDALNRALNVYFYGDYQRLRHLASRAARDTAEVCLKWKDQLIEFNRNHCSKQCFSNITDSILRRNNHEHSVSADNHVVFRYFNPNIKAKKVNLVGSFDGWEGRKPMVYDRIKNIWHVTMRLTMGTYFYKYVVDNNIWMVSEYHPIERDSAGNINNRIEIL